MSKRILGLDLGTNSIGWSVIELDNERGMIPGIGSRIFPMGINLEKGTKEESKNATRREKRQIRRQNFRTKLRKEKLTHLLIKHGMFPDIDSVYKKLTGNNVSEEKFRGKFQTVIREKELPIALRSFFTIDPYKARSKAYKGEKLSFHEIGRIFYHFAQRRGYKETLQNQDEDSGALYEGKPKEGKTGINETKEKIEEYGTLGNYLHHEDSHKKRLRNRYTLRSMYEEEFEIIWEHQKEFYPEIFTEDLRIKIGGSKRRGDTKDGILFYQRPLRSQKHLIGNCSFETNKPRCQLSAIPFELFRTYQTINSILDGEQPLNEEDRKIALEVFNSKDKAFPFKTLRTKLSRPDGNYNYKDKDKLPGNRTIASFQKIFGKERWHELSLKEQEDIWHIKLTADDPDWLDRYAEEKWELYPDEIEKFKSFTLKDGYANLSRKAILNILPYLKKGFIYDKAVLLGGLRAAFGSKAWDEMGQEKKTDIEKDVLNIISNHTEGKIVDKIKELLVEKFALPKNKADKLYHHSLEKEVELEGKLPSPDTIRNPIVQQTLFELRTVVNSIIEEYGAPDEIRIELARELKSSKKHRDRIRDRQQEREAENIRIKARLDEYGIKHTRSNIQKVLLWEECEGICPFTGEKIGLTELFDEGYVQVEHIIPYSVSLDNGLQNKTLCLAYKNQEKGNLTPYQAFGGTSEWDKMKQRAYRLFKKNNPKYRRFISKKKPDAEGFIERQLNDTRYISKIAKTYLKHACPKVTVAQGTVTSMLRHFWGLDGILNDFYEVGDVEDGEYLAAIDAEDNVAGLLPWNKETLKKDQKTLEKKGQFIQGNVKDGTLYPFKERDDHRHHAIDALTVACSERKYLQQISTLSAKGWDNWKIKKEKSVDLPWDNFWQDANLAVNRILVSHKKTDRVLTKVKKQLFDYNGKPKTKNGKRLFAEGMAARGQLHQDTVYGKHEDKNGEEYFHVRKPLDTINNSAKVDKIVDPKIRELVRAAVKRANSSIDLNKKYSVPKNAFFEIDEETKKRKPLVHLPNKNGDPIPVKKVRIKENIGNAEQLKDGINQFVNPKNNHHVLIYENKEGNIAEQVITFWEAVERKAQDQSIIQLPANGNKIITSMQINDLFLLGLTDEQIKEFEDDYMVLSQHLFRVQTLSSKYYEFRLISESTRDNKIEPYFHRIQSFGNGKTGWRRFNPRKVEISATGKLTLVS
ncbi:MAG: type II CRISPR RNA-guided endonuclease Cas9 [Gracilimonas sp.]|uniref:type II CRISPR RNA-guided endonuclease Cas9 n=1 Tax=Gracilimonas sp. TaxID=1974203 RepID=UPI003751BB53|nr:type II CRISPR RNA-guided endonuclease Cas9 [Gracilimonas sp.]